MPDDIVGAFQAIASGLCESLRRRKVFDAFRDLLRALEDARARNVPLLPEAVGELRGLLFAVETLGCWPAPDYRTRYLPRAMFILASTKGACKHGRLAPHGEAVHLTGCLTHLSRSSFDAAEGVRPLLLSSSCHAGSRRRRAAIQGGLFL